MRALPENRPPRATVTAATLLLTLGLTAGCGGSDTPEDTAPTAAAEATTPSQTPTEQASEGASERASAEPAAEDCSVAVPEMLAATSMLGNVTDITVDGCDLATVTTSLTATADEVDGATGVCSSAANEAAGHGIAATVVVAADGTELARGTSSADCVGTFTG